VFFSCLYAHTGQSLLLVAGGRAAGGFGGPSGALMKVSPVACGIPQLLHHHLFHTNNTTSSCPARLIQTTGKLSFSMPLLFCCSSPRPRDAFELAVACSTNSRWQLRPPPVSTATQHYFVPSLTLAEIERYVPTPSSYHYNALPSWEVLRLVEAFATLHDLRTRKALRACLLSFLEYTALS
jgi:hypothetical protein